MFLWQIHPSIYFLSPHSIYLFYSISCTQGLLEPVAAAVGQRQGATQNPDLSYCCYAGLFLFLPNFLLMSQFAPYWVKVEPRRRSLSESSWTLTVTFWVDSFSFKRTSLIGSRMNVSFWCHVSLSLPPSLSPSIPHPDVPIRVSGNTECTCCRLIGASVHADSCTHGPRSKRRLNEGTVLFVLMVNSSQITVLRRQFSLKINKWINKYKKNQLALTHKLLSNRKQVCRPICRRTAAKKRFTPQNRIKSMEEETRVLVDLM